MRRWHVGFFPALFSSRVNPAPYFLSAARALLMAVSLAAACAGHTVLAQELAERSPELISDYAQHKQGLPLPSFTFHTSKKPALTIVCANLRNYP